MSSQVFLIFQIKYTHTKTFQWVKLLSCCTIVVLITAVQHVLWLSALHVKAQFTVWLIMWSKRYSIFLRYLVIYCIFHLWCVLNPFFYIEWIIQPVLDKISVTMWLRLRSVCQKINSCHHIECLKWLLCWKRKTVFLCFFARSKHILQCVWVCVRVSLHMKWSLWLNTLV